MRKVILKFQLRESLEAKVEIGRPVGLTEVSGGQTQLLTPALAGAETWGSFAHVYAQGDPKVSALGKGLDQKLRSAAPN
jgi:hypothetical protein